MLFSAALSDYFEMEIKSQMKASKLLGNSFDKRKLTP